MGLKRKQTNNRFLLKDYWVLIMLGSVILLFAFTGVKRALKNYLLNKNGVIVKAVIIDDENFFGNNTLIFAYSYSFTLNGKGYIGNSFRPELKVGDSFLIEYTPTYPDFNKSVDDKMKK